MRNLLNIILSTLFLLSHLSGDFDQNEESSHESQAVLNEEQCDELLEHRFDDSEAMRAWHNTLDDEEFWEEDSARNFSGHRASVKHDSKKEDHQEESNLALMTLEASPASIVAGCVNAISGAFIESHIGLTVPGALPLTVQCTYCSTENDWHFRHQPEMKASESRGKHHLNIDYTDDQGGRMRFRGSVDRADFTIPDTVFEKGVTNCGSGELSGKTHLKNNRVVFIRNEEGKGYRLRTGSWNQRIFNYMKREERHHQGPPIGKFWLKEEIQPNGNKIKYEYGKSHSYDSLNEIMALKQTGGILGRLTINRPRSGEVNWASTDGQVNYIFDKHEKRIQEIKPSHAIPVTYKYNADDRLEKKILPDGRFLKITYQDSPDSWRHKPVHKLSAPVGEKGETVCTHEFTYEKEDIWQGTMLYGRHPFGTTSTVYLTKVRDALGNITTYTYGKNNKRLQSIEKSKNGKVYIHEHFYWSKSGDLKFRYFKGEDKIFFCRAYDYDSFGNVEKERIWGNLTGRNNIPIEIGKHGVIENGCELYSKTRTFSKDGRNLLLTEDDGRKVIICRYYKKGNLLKSRFTWNKNQTKLLKREFFKYESGILTNEIWDDGNTINEEDLSGVTERHEKNIILNGIGLPETIEEYCSGKLVKKLINFYNPQGKLKEQQHYGSNNKLAYTLFWEYHPLGNVKEEVNAIGEVSVYDYDANGNKTLEKSPGEEIIKIFTYDTANRLTNEEEIWKDGRRFNTTHRYNTLNQRILTIDIYGQETHFEYDLLGRMVKKQHPSIEDENGILTTPIEETQYDPMGNIIAQIDAKGHSTLRESTIRGQPYKITYPDGSVEQKYYTVDGLLECEIGKNGLVTNYQHDAFGRVTKTTISDSAGNVLKQTASIYDTFHLRSEIDELGIETKYDYDWAGRLSEKRRGDHCTTYKYDPLGRNNKIVETIDETRNRTTTKNFDSLGRIKDERIKDGPKKVLKKELYTYDLHGNCQFLTTYTHAGESNTETTYLPNGEPLKIIDALGNVTSIKNEYRHRHKGQFVRRTITTDPLGNQEIKIYDLHQRLNYKIQLNPKGEIVQKERYAYNVLGQKKRTHFTVYHPDKEPHQIIIEWDYDCMGNIIRCTEAKGAKEERTTLHHFENGQKKWTKLPNGKKIEYTYNALGLLETCLSNDGSISYHYQYNLKDQPELVKDLVHGTFTHRNYDHHGRLTDETLEHGMTIVYDDYDHLDRPQSITLPDQTKIYYRYNALYLTSVKRGDFVHRYENYDFAGNVDFETLIGKAGKIHYTYDLLERPTHTTTPSWKEEIKEFDTAGNLLKRHVIDDQGSLDYVYTYDDLYQLTSEQGACEHTYKNDSLHNRIEKDGAPYAINDLNQLRVQRNWTYQYDENGNLTQRSTETEKITYQYDALDRLIKVEEGSNIITYSYDAFHRRLSKTKNGVTTYFLYQGQNEIGTISKGKIDQLRVLGITRGAEIGSAILLELHGKTYVPIHDSFGNVIAIHDTSGKLIESYRYSAFGETQVFSHEGIDNPWRYSSKRFDPETNLYYFGRRYYAPDIGRWITPDPLGFEDGPNLYTYAHNQPLSFIDPDGQFAFLLAPVAWYCVQTAIGMAAEYCLPVALASLGESSLGITAGAFLTGVVKGYNGSAFEAGSFADAGFGNALAEFGGKLVGSALSTGPKALGNLTKTGAHMLCKEGGMLAEKAILNKTVQVVRSNVTKGAINKGVKETNEAQFRKFVDGNFRENMKRLTKIDPGTSAEAHHIFPRKFESVFSKKGINIHDPKYGTWWEKSMHRSNARDYNQKWFDFIKKHPFASHLETLNHGKQLMSNHGIDVYY